MSFKAVIMYPLVIFFLFVQVLASRMDESHIVLNTEEVTRDSLTIRGETYASGLSANEPVCSNSNQANKVSCTALLKSLLNDSSALDDSPRDICYTQNGNKCCVSWGKQVTGLLKKELWPSASAIFSNCSRENGVSGVQRDVELHGIKTIQCLSNRDGKCNG